MRPTPRQSTLALFTMVLACSLAACSSSGGDGGGGGGNPTPANTVPLANAGADQATPLVGDVVILDASNSSDADGDPLTYSWSLTTLPNGSAATLSDPAAPTPEFVADVSGEYVARLTVNDGEDDSVSDEVAVTVRVPAPVVTITGPEPLAVVTTSSVTVTGTVGDPAAVIEVNGAAVTNQNGSFTSQVALQEGSNTVAVVSRNGTGEDSASVDVLLNTQDNPVISITSPRGLTSNAFLVGEEFQPGTQFQAAQVAVSGVIKVNTSALLPNLNRPTVTVNGVSASVSLDPFFSQCALFVNPFQCWKFTATIPLEQGNRDITAVGTDVDGLSTTTPPISGTVDYCVIGAKTTQANGTFVPALRGTNQSNRCHEVDGCSVPGSDRFPLLKDLSNNPMPLAIANLSPIEFGAGTSPPSEYFIHGLDPARALGCNTHDVCYQTRVAVGARDASWKACNLGQYEDHLSACRRAYPVGAACPFTGLEAVKCPAWRVEFLIERSRCFNRALAYYTAVSTNQGWEVYLERQEQYGTIP